MQRNNSGKSWLVQQWITKDHMQNHYRRLGKVKSCLNLSENKQFLPKRKPNSINLDSKLRDLEERFSSSWSVSTKTVASMGTNSRKAETFDPTNDILCTHSRYFSKPDAPFTPKTLRKIVPSQEGIKKNNQRRTVTEIATTTNLVSVSKQSTARSNARVEPKPPTKPTNAEQMRIATRKRLRNQISSTDSAFSEPFCRNTEVVVEDVDSLQSLQFQKWLQEQEEESRYLSLMYDITADLLQRGLCKNGLVKQIIAGHVQQNQRNFSVRATTLLERLCKDLFVPISAELDSELYGSSRTKWPVSHHMTATLTNGKLQDEFVLETSEDLRRGTSTLENAEESFNQHCDQGEDYESDFLDDESDTVDEIPEMFENNEDL